MLTQRYEAPTTVADAVRLMQADPQATPLAGGTDLLVQYRAGLRRPSAFIDLKRIPALMGITLDEAGMRLGSATSAAEVCEHGEARRLWPGLVEAVGLLGSTQIQGRGSVGGNLCNGSPAADTTCPLIVNRARALIAGPKGERTVDVDGFTTGPGKTVLAPGEVLVALLPAEFRAIDQQSTMGAYVGTLDQKGGKGTMVQWRYADGKAYMPTDAYVRTRRPADAMK